MVKPISETHKRRQLCAGFQEAQTDVIVICDDDTRWSENVLENLVRPLLAQPVLGCVFPDLRVDPVGKSFTIWELLGLLRHVGDGVDFHASLCIDGGVFCHHGSTAAYQASILRDEEFINAFSNDRWRGHLLNSGDDQFLCRWLVNHGWRVALCSAEFCQVRTRSRASWKHMLQLLRWSRNDWRSSLSGLIWERHMLKYIS
jgi:cellulose synthase/poly-beta-1,6-N-acetylglucosamine synthase-like glycosyltransferase